MCYQRCFDAQKAAFFYEDKNCVSHNIYDWSSTENDGQPLVTPCVSSTERGDFVVSQG